MRSAPHILLLIAASALVSCNGGGKQPPPPGNKPRVLVISIDGLRPDVALRAEMPNLRGLMRRGSFTFWARTTEASITLPSHVSMLTGVTPHRHAVAWNDDFAKAEDYPPPVPSLLDLADAHGYTTGHAFGKSKLRMITREDSVPADCAYVPNGYAQNHQVAAEAAKIIAAHRPEVMFVHFADVDAEGHGAGWGTPEQVKAAESADQGIGTIVYALDRAGVLDKTTILVTSDHGGQSNWHGPWGNTEDPRSRHIPWVVAGPDTKHDYDLTRHGFLVVNTEDTFATACWLLGIPIDEDGDGKPITLAFEERHRPELVRNAE